MASNEGQVKSIYRTVEKVSGLSGECPEKIYESINDALDYLYIFPGAKDAFFTERGCAIVQCFCEDCAGSCGNKYNGINLPANVIQATCLSWNNKVIDLEQRFDSGEQYGNCVCASCCGSWSAEDMGDSYLWEYPPDCNWCGRVVFHNDSVEDNQELIGVDSFNNAGINDRYDIVLTGSGSPSKHTNKFREVTFPERCGYIEARTEGENHLLGRYHPNITIPKHRRFRLFGPALGSKVEWEGRVKLPRVFYDTDIVPFTSPTIWASAIRASRLNLKDNLSTEEENSLARAIRTIAAAIAEEMQAEDLPSSFNLRPDCKDINRAIRLNHFGSRSNGVYYGR